MQTTSSSARKRHINIQHTWLKSLIAVGGGYRLNIPRVNHSRVRVGVRVSVGVSTGVGDGGRRAPAPPNPPKKMGDIFWAIINVKLGNFVHFSGFLVIFRANIT